MRRLVQLVEGGLRAVAALCLAGLTGLVLLQVVLRYTGAGVPAFIEEVARYAMIWMALLIAAVAVREGSHIRIDILPAAIGARSPAARRVLEAFLDTVSLTIFLVLLWYGIDMVRFGAMQTSEGMRIPLSYPYVCVPVAFALAAVFAALRIIANRHREHAPERAA
ncbi:TRAP transporter small permease [Acuticoccus sp. MNP-M23]|uniref:TRAP transporter small permease n=1 Tax=Acuticoccus sp. MNP-M23 TaxID=3072793 RepID=UPI0028153552|nr:TRAP transporter small permease [Acuticoccus sp. MNP-M23]WMS42381.1 TRAP transporter small permease [Acuticoccus sp. MNP-M23]